MKDCNCIFCKIANGEIPSATLYEDEEFRVILDLGPATKGHALILPKEHYANLYEIPEETAGKSIILAKKMVTRMKKALNCDGFNVLQNNEEPAGQTVFHYHMHLIPRYEGDNAFPMWNAGELTDEVRDEVLKKVKETEQRNIGIQEYIRRQCYKAMRDKEINSGNRVRKKNGFDAVYEEYHKMVFRIAYHYTCNREEAEDISQVVFGRYYIFSETGRVTNVRSWLATTARNVAVNHVKHISYERLLWAKETMEDYLGYEEDPEEQFFGTLREKDEIECACRILAALKTKKRKWYNLAVYAYCNEMPRQEIADRMGMSLDAVMSTLTRIKDWIRKNYKDEFDHINT